MAIYRIVVVGIDNWKRFTQPFLVGLRRHNPGQVITLVDNASETPYPSRLRRVHVIRLERRVGYASAINAGAGGEWDWMIVCNNDCLCDGNVTGMIPSLARDTLYGAGADAYYQDMQLSGYLYIPRRVWERVGEFDPGMDAAFEDFDYMLRVKEAGLKLASVKAPIRHLFAHTRYQEYMYENRWQETFGYFKAKHPGKLRNIHGMVEV